MGERGKCALFRELKIYSVGCYGFERVQLIERAVLFLFHMTVIPAVGGGSYPPMIFPKEVMRMSYSFALLPMAYFPYSCSSPPAAGLIYKLKLYGMILRRGQAYGLFRNQTS